MHAKRIEALRDTMKTTDEIATLRKAAGITDEAVRRSLPAIREGITMRELQLEIEMHELPWLEPRIEETIVPRMVFAL